ncbi:MAG: SDR family oxidoreductase [Deltaproteobacteria bacterium]|jgi:2-deoxy-D-gluconate 3-dehydrogenase|nr:SDR family oxidoreductase [Deltaproteobacteria bacterium]
MNGKYKSFGLENTVAIVTGASQGIGRTLAIALAEAGAHLALVSRTQSALEAVAKEIETLGRQALVVPADIADVAQIRSMVSRVQAHFGKIDILINNAAWTVTAPALDVSEEEWDQTLDSCLKSVFFLCQSVAPMMIEQGKGHIVNMGSTFGEVTFKTRSVYAAAKAGVHHLTRALANEWSDKGVHVNAIGPCVTETPTRREIFERPGYKEWALGQMLPIGRWAQPEDFIGATLFLCSSLSDMVVGHVLMVDGGWVIH